MKARVVSSVGVALLCAACGEPGHVAVSGPSAAAPDAGDKDNSTFETADPIEVGSMGVLDFVDGREDQDFFSFEGRSGEWVEIRSSYFDAFIFADTRLTLYDADHVQLAYNQFVDSIKGEKVLARIVTRLPTTGRYFVEVADPEGPPYSAGLSQAYRLSITELANSPAGYTVEPDGDADQTPVIFHEWNLDPVVIDDSFLVGTFADSNDVDRFSFTVPPGEVQNLNAEVLESGTLADGSTTSAGKVWLTDETGANVIGRIDNASGQYFLAPPLEPGNYAIWVAHPDTPIGANDFYVVRTLLGPENPVEAADATNGSVASAEPLTMSASFGRNAAYFLAHVLADDVDYFRFDGQEGQTTSTFCESAEGGSGLVGLHVSVRDETDKILLEATETAAAPSAPGTTISLENVAIPAGGSIYVRTSKDGQLPDVVGDWVRCAVYVQ
jgi:hypothetical protein